MFLFRVFLRGLCFKYFLSYIIIKTRCTCLTIFSPVQFKTRRRPASRPSPRAPAPCWGIQTESCSATSGARLPGQDVLELDIELVLFLDHEVLLDHLLRHVRGAQTSRAVPGPEPTLVSSSGPTQRSLAGGCTPQVARTAAAHARPTHMWRRHTEEPRLPRSAPSRAPRIRRDSGARCTPHTQLSPARHHRRQSARGRYARPPASYRPARESRATCDLRGSDRA